jgi:hypothetical protein
MTVPTLRIARRFCGPPASANGGYAAGALATHIHHGGPVTVTLRKPPPLEVALRVDQRPGGDAADLYDDDMLVAEASAGAFTRDRVTAVSLDTAYAAQASYEGLLDPTFQSCFVCGTSRSDGLRLAPGRTAPGFTACVWTPDESLTAADDNAVAAAEFVWAALDCPGGWTTDMLNRPLVLGRMTAEVRSRPPVGDPVVVVAEHASTQGRKTMTSTSAYGSDGALLGRAEQIWIAIDGDVFYPT